MPLARELIRENDTEATGKRIASSATTETKRDFPLKPIIRNESIYKREKMWQTPRTVSNLCSPRGAPHTELLIASAAVGC